MDDVDAYCERVAPGRLGEPAKAATNLAFLIAADVLVWLLPVQLGVIGLYSLAFHTFATSFTGMLDSLSILLFILVAALVALVFFGSRLAVFRGRGSSHLGLPQ